MPRSPNELRDGAPAAGDAISLLRLLLAGLVLLGHAYVLGGFGEEPLSAWSAGTTSGRQLAVQGFFVLSGYLLAGSLVRQPSLGRYALRRFFRIVPGYWVCLLVTGLVLAPALLMFGYEDGPGYARALTLGPHDALRYMRDNWLFTLGGGVVLPLFGDNPYPLAINGSLWSIPFEVMCYAGLGLLAAARWLGKRWPVYLLFGGLCALQVAHLVHPLAASGLETKTGMTLYLALHPAGPTTVLAFLAGVTAWLVTGGRRTWHPLALGAAVAALAVAIPLRLTALVFPLALPCLLINLAYGLPLRWPARWGDFSYGLYLYAFPIQQTLCFLGLHHLGFGVYLALSAGISLLAGALSWYLVERPAQAAGLFLIKRRGSETRAVELPGAPATA